MDLCTLIVTTTMTLAQCYEPPRCADHLGRRLCTEGAPKPCPSPPPAYRCTRPDGTAYSLSLEAAEK